MKRIGYSVVVACAPALAVVLLLTGGGCGADDDQHSSDLVFVRPAPQELAASGPVAVELSLPAAAALNTLVVSIDGQAVADELTIVDDVATGALVVGADGTHRLTAEVQVAGMLARAETSFETITLVNPDLCEVLNPEECLLPYPSSRFLEPADTPTGYRLSFPRSGMPLQNDTPIDPAPFGTLDGFSPLAQIVMLFPGGVDPVASDAPRLLPATRATDLRSLDPDSPTLLLDWDSGEHILHFVEPDVRAEATPDRQALFLRPGLSLTPGRRYIVAVRRLVHRDGTAVTAPAPFAALRDARPTSIVAIESRQEHFERLFDRLAAAGVERGDLLLAFDFVVQSEESLSGQMLAMRDQAFAWLAEQETMQVQTFAVDEVVDRDCSLPATSFGREVYGTFEVPLFLSADPVANRDTPATLQVDSGGAPLQNGTMAAPFTIAIPCAAVREGEMTPLAPLVRGHGLFDYNRGVIDLRITYDALPPLDLIEGATDWTGFALPDLGFFLSAANDLNLLPALADRGRQGLLNTLVLARMMKTGAFNRDAAFQAPDGAGVLAGPEAEMYYAGGSLGGNMGLAFAALSPDVSKIYADVGGIDVYGLTAERSAEGLSNEDEPLQHALLVALTHEMMVRADGAGYATHVTANPLAGTNAKNVLLTMAWLDQYMPNLVTEVAARTLQLPNLDGSLLSDLPLIADLSGPLASAFVTFDTGAFDLDDPAHAGFIPPLANLPAADPVDFCEPHGLRVLIPAAAEQVQAFLRPGGMVENFCNGACDASEPLELPNGAATPCDPLEE